MARRRTGSVRKSGDGWVVGFRLSPTDPYAPKRLWERRVPPPTDGGPITEEYAHLCIAKAVREYESGRWHPYLPETPEPNGEPVENFAIRWKANEDESFVYVIKARKSLVKIGTSTDLKRRLLTISGMSPLPLQVLAILEGGPFEESQLHIKFARHRRHGEWFEPVPEIIEWAMGVGIGR